MARLFYQWFDPLAWKGFRKPLETSDLWDMKQEDTGREVVPQFEKYWLKSVKKAERYITNKITVLDILNSY